MLHQQLNAFLVDKVDDMKAQDIQTIDVQGKSSITDFMIVCTGTSKRHVASIADHLAREAKLAGLEPKIAGLKAKLAGLRANLAGLGAKLATGRI